MRNFPMRRYTAILTFWLISASLPAQTALWHTVSPRPTPPEAGVPAAAPAQIQQIRKLLSTHGLMQFWDCKSSDPDGEWLQNLSFTPVSLAPHQTTFLVQAGQGCARGAQGANGALWIVRFTASHPQLLAAPDLGFSGWLFQIPTTASHGYRDIILAWHMGYNEANLSYFRFNGRLYRQVSTAKAVFADDGRSTITPDPKPNAAAKP